jgi:hypothetical protein
MEKSVKVKGLTRTVEHKHFPIGLISPTWRRDATPVPKHVEIDDFLRDFLGSFLEVQIDDPDNPGFRTTVRKYLIANWQEMAGGGDYPTPAYLEDFFDSRFVIEEALAYIYTSFSFMLEHTKDVGEIPKSMRRIFRSVPHYLEPFARELKPADLDFIVQQLASPKLSGFVEFLEQLDPPYYAPGDLTEAPKARMRFRKELFGLLVRYAANREVADLVAKHTAEVLEDIGARDHPEHVAESIYNQTVGIISKKVEAPDIVPFAAGAGAMYELVYPLPQCLVAPRLGRSNRTVMSEKMSERLRQFAGQPIVEVEAVKVFADYVPAADLPSLEPDVFTATVSAEPVVQHVPRGLLNPRLAVFESEYVFGCSKRCPEWQERAGKHFYWHPFYRIWVEYGSADRARWQEYLQLRVQPEHDLEFVGARYCPWCGAPLSEGRPYLVRGHLPESRRAYNYEEDYVEVRSPYTKYHVDLWDRMLRFYFKSEHLGEDKLTLTDNYIFMADKKIREDIREVTLEAIGEHLVIGGISFSKQELIFLSFVLYPARSLWEESMLGEGSVDSFGEVEDWG